MSWMYLQTTDNTQEDGTAKSISRRCDNNHDTCRQRRRRNSVSMQSEVSLTEPDSPQLTPQSLSNCPLQNR